MRATIVKILARRFASAPNIGSAAPEINMPKILTRTLQTVALLLTSSLLMGASPRKDNAPEMPLKGQAGVTSMSGQVVDMSGQGLPGVELSVGASRARSDSQGRFLVEYAIPGWTILQIDGRHAGAKNNIDYGYYEVQVEAKSGLTTVLPFKNWLPKIDHSRDVTITSPTKSEIIVRTPDIPDFELRIPAGTVIKDVDGKVVTKVGITAVPPDRTPFPLPAHIDIPVYFTIQPGAACLYDAKGGVGKAVIHYPNFNKELPKARANLWRYEPDANGWTTYGIGVVSADGKQIVPEAGAGLTDFYSAQCDPATRTRIAPPERPERKRTR